MALSCRQGNRQQRETGAGIVRSQPTTETGPGRYQKTEKNLIKTQSGSLLKVNQLVQCSDIKVFSFC